MKTDSLFSRLFQDHPDLVFQLIGDTSPRAGTYAFGSQEVKQLAVRIDGALPHSLLLLSSITKNGFLRTLGEKGRERSGAADDAWVSGCANTCITQSASGAFGGRSRAFCRVT